MSKPVINTIDSRSGKSYRVTLCSVHNLKRKKSYFLLEEVHRDGRLNVTTVDLVDAGGEPSATRMFKNHVRSRELLENLREFSFVEQH